MRSILTFAAMASLAVANAVPAATPVTIHHHEGDGNVTLEARDAPPWPGYLQCKQGRFKLPCTWTATGGNGAMDCHRLMYAEGQKNPGTSFGPDKGVTCRFYDSSDCAQGGTPLNVIWPGGDLLQLGRDAGSFPPDSVEGFWSFRCRSWQQADNDAAQSKYIKLPKRATTCRFALEGGGNAGTAKVMERRLVAYAVTARFLWAGEPVGQTQFRWPHAHHCSFAS